MGTHLQMRTVPERGSRERNREETREQRLARARAALGAAEISTAHQGGRIDRTAFSGGLGGPTGLVGSGTAHPPEAPSVPSAPGRPVQGDPAPDAHTRVPLPPPLAPLTPYGSLRAGSTVAVDGSCSVSLLLAMAAAAVGEDGWCALAGLPDVGLRAARDAGLDLGRLALAPATTSEEMPQLPQVLSALVDGVGVLVLGPRLRLAPALWRSLTDRARAHDTLVLAAAPAGRADLHLRAEAESWEGLGQGTGRLRRRTLRVSAAGRGIPEGRSVDVVLPEVHGLLAESPGTGRAERSDTAGRRSAPRPLHAIRRAG
jgi:hypothetical protein